MTTTNTTQQDHDDTSMEWREITLAGVTVLLTEPKTTLPRGITFLLTGAMIPQREYTSIREVLVHDQKQVVIGIYINVLTTAHEWYAQKIPLIHRAYLETLQQTQQQQQGFQDVLQKTNQYNIVGHSVGGKICLLVAAIPESNNNNSEEPRVHTVLALDPVDLNPSVFTGTTRPPLNHSPAHVILLTWADATSAWSIPPSHNAQAIHDVLQHASRALQPLVIHHGAGHMAYTDTGGGWLGACLMRGGRKEANHEALANVHDLLRKYI